MTKIFVEVDSKNGVRKTTSRVTSVSEANEAGKLSAAIAFPLSLVNDAALESAGLPITNREFGQSIWVPRVVDEELGADDFEQIELGLAEAPRSLNEDPADWIAAAIKKAYPNHSAWSSVGQNHVFMKSAKAAETSPLGVEYPAEAEKSFQVLADSESDVALHILLNTHGANGRHEDQFLDEHCIGWLDDETKGTVLVTDLYTMDETLLAAVQNFVFESGLRFSISGTSSHYPSKTFRLSIWKE
jgi:hypothetical protein